MEFPILTYLGTFVSIVSGVPSIVATVRKERLSKKQGIVLLTSTAIVCILLILITIVLQGKKTVWPPTPDLHSTATPDVSGLRTVYLDDLKPLISNKESYFFKQWPDSDGMYVEGQRYDHAIGIKVSSEQLKEYYSKKSNERVAPHESITFPLREEYKGISFSVGFDQNSLTCLDDTTPACECRIIFESKGSSSNKNDRGQVIYDSDWFRFDQRIKQFYVALEQVDALRITAYWTFDVDPTQENCLNLVFYDTVLYKKNDSQQVSVP
jgi:hypothetical protein